MPPTLSKVAVVAAPGITVISGLRCGHAECYALFSTIEDSEEHALKVHSGNVVAVTCNIQEKRLESGQIQLFRVLDDEQAVATPDDVSHGVDRIETPPVSQSTLSRGRSLSRQSTEPAIDIPSSSLSSFSSLSSLSFSSASSGTEYAGDQKLDRVLAVVQDLVSECRICWVRRETTRPHRTFKCPTRICSGHNWDKFKVGLQFPKNVVCFFCLCPYGPPFNHQQTSRASADLCDYPDVLKELVYILYQNEALRTKIFTKLGVARPSSLSQYQRFIGKRQREGIYGAFEVVNAYIELRESGEL